VHRLTLTLQCPTCATLLTQSRYEVPSAAHSVAPCSTKTLLQWLIAKMQKPQPGSGHVDLTSLQQQPRCGAYLPAHYMQRLCIHQRMIRADMLLPQTRYPRCVRWLQARMQQVTHTPADDTDHEQAALQDKRMTAWAAPC
jgi:hypothetical protein